MENGEALLIGEVGAVGGEVLVVGQGLPAVRRIVGELPQFVVGGGRFGRAQVAGEQLA